MCLPFLASRGPGALTAALRAAAPPRLCSSGNAAPGVAGLRDGDLLSCVVVGGPAEAAPAWLEVIKPAGPEGGGAVAVGGGWVYEIAEAGPATWSLRRTATHRVPDALLAWVMGPKAEIPGAVDQLRRIVDVGIDPVDPDEAPITISAVAPTTTLDRFARCVGADAGPWTDGSPAEVGDGGRLDVLAAALAGDCGAGAAPKVAEATSQAGELLALLHGRRGLAVFQLWLAQVVDGPKFDSPSLLGNPFLLRVLCAAAADPRVQAALSVAEDGNERGALMGLSIVVHAKTEAFVAVGQRLAQLGVCACPFANGTGHRGGPCRGFGGFASAQCPTAQGCGTGGHGGSARRWGPRRRCGRWRWRGGYRGGW